MNRLLTLTLICSLVLAFTTPVSADYFWYKDVSADDFVNALVAYCNHNEVHNMTEPEFELSGHDFRSYNVVKEYNSLDFDYESGGFYGIFPLLIPIPFPESYKFTGHMHVTWPCLGIENPYELTIYDSDKKFTACGLNWILSGENDNDTRFYANDDDPNRQTLTVVD